MRILLFALLILLISGNCLAIPKPIANPSGDSIVIHKKSTSRAHRFYLYPDASQKVLFFNVRGYDGRAYQLYVFNMDGQVVKQAEIRNKQTTLVGKMEKGNYLFEVFSDDDRIGNGQIAVK